MLSQPRSVNRVCCSCFHLTNSSTTLDYPSTPKKYSLLKELSRGWIGLQRDDEVSLSASWPPPLATEEELTAVTTLDPSSFQSSRTALQGVVATFSRISTGLCQAYLGRSKSPLDRRQGFLKILCDLCGVLRNSRQTP